VEYATVDGTAMAGSDYTAAAGQLTFAPGQTERTVTVAVGGDATIEPDETFTVELGNPNGATIADFQGLGTIRNDDGLWQNPDHPCDVNNDDFYTTQDTLTMAKFLYYNGQRPVPEGPGEPPFPVQPPPYYDVNGSDYVTMQDALIVAKFLYYNGQGPVPKGSGAPSPAAELPSYDDLGGDDPVATQDTLAAATTMGPGSSLDKRDLAGTPVAGSIAVENTSAVRPTAPSASQIASAALLVEKAASSTLTPVGRKDVNSRAPAGVPVAARGVGGYSAAEPTAASAQQVALTASVVDRIMADAVGADDTDFIDWDFADRDFSSSRRGREWDVLDDFLTKLDPLSFRKTPSGNCTSRPYTPRIG